jgi:DNA-binding transcriptional ArsR family regulator
MSVKRRAYSDPVRLRIIESLAANERRTAKQLADEIGVTANRLYYHLRLLEGAGLVQIAGAESTSGGSERVYAPSAPYGAGNELPGTDPAERVVFFSSILEATKAELADVVIEQGRQADDGAPQLLAKLIRGALYGTHDTFAEFGERLSQLLDELNQRALELDPTDVIRFPVTFAMYELPESEPIG